MRHKRCSVLILVTALLIIGMRGVCMAQYSQHVSIDKSDTQERNDVQVATINKSIESQLTGFVVERTRTGFTFRVKRYSHVAPKPFHRITGPGISIPTNHVNPVEPAVRPKPLKRIKE